MKRLLVIIPDRITDLLDKGEYPPRYYNPGDFFDDVHLMLMNDDRPDPARLQHIVGSANVTVHNFAPASFDETWFRVRWLRPWADQAVEIARAVGPGLVRAYGHYTSTFAAAEIKRRLQVPMVVSLHGNPDVDYYRGRLATTCRQRLEGWLSRGYEVASLRAADVVIPVYSPIVPFLKSIGVTKYEVVYNAVGYGLVPRSDYAAKPRWRALCVGRQTIDQKNPSAIVEAMQGIDELSLDLVGDGGLHDGLKALAARCGVADRISFHRTMENSRVLELVQHADLFVYQSDNFEISKGTMEAALAGLPIVLNRRKGGLAEEILQSPFLVVDGTVDGYRAGIRKVLDDHAFRADLGCKAARYAECHWNPQAMENRVVEIYRSLTA